MGSLPEWEVAVDVGIENVYPYLVLTGRPDGVDVGAVPLTPDGPPMGGGM